MRKSKQLGFTLAELLIVVAIIGVLVAIGIPVFTSQLEKSREAVDAANIRSMYAEVLSEALTNPGEDINADGAQYIDLAQMKDGWANEEMGSNLQVHYACIEGEEPLAGGRAWVKYVASEDTVVLCYSDGDGTVTGGGINWSKFTTAGEYAKTQMPDRYTAHTIYEASEMSASESKLVDELKDQLGIDADVTVSIRYLNPKNTIQITIVEQDLRREDFASGSNFSSAVWATRVNYDTNTGSISCVTKEYGKWGCNGAQGDGFWQNDMGGKFPTEVIYEAGSQT